MKTSAKTITVISRFDKAGDPTPLKFTWKDHTYDVTAVGRRWQDTDGLHILVLTVGEQAYELIYLLDGSWKLNKLPKRHQPA